MPNQKVKVSSRKHSNKKLSNHFRYMAASEKNLKLKYSGKHSKGKRPVEQRPKNRKNKRKK